jgi:LmbE family N-acetylglucosaminyl deacetylase
MKIFISPHNDDEVLFGAFTLLRERPLVVFVFDSYVQPSRGLSGTSAERRRAESLEACGILGCECRFLGLRDDAEASAIRIGSLIEDLEPSEIWAPASEVGGHAQHNLVAAACNRFPAAHRYLTYTAAGKSFGLKEVPIQQAYWIPAKLFALASYTSQHSLDPRMGCWPHFIGDQREYVL